MQDQPPITEIDHNTDDFNDFWKASQQVPTREDMSQPHFTFTDDSDDLQNVLRLDLLTEFQELTHAPTQNDALLQATQSSGYPCTSYQSNSSGMIRSYPNEINQPINNHQTTMSSMNNHPIGMSHMGYQTTSPSNGDGASSSHNSPFTTSPSQGFDYPTSPHVKPSIPPNTDYPGDYNFAINFGETTESAPKSAQYTYSHTLNKLFVKMNVTCPVRFKCNSLPPMGCTIRAIPVFKRPEHVTDVVTRCPNHRIPDANYIHSSGHLIRAEMPDDLVRYNITSDGRESVSVRFERPQIGAEFTTILFKFMCLSSCVGGINRRPLLTVFNLETADGQVLGRRVVEVRICSCPGRDRAQEEKRKFNEGSSATSNGQEKNLKRPYKNVQATMEINQTFPGKKRRATPNSGDQEEFVLKIRGREKFLMLKRVKEALDLMEYVTPQQQEAYRSKEEQEQAVFRQQLATDAASGISSRRHGEKDVPSTPSISSVFSVSNPLSGEEASSAIEGIMCPSHSSHPLTATPTGVTAGTGDECPVTESLLDSSTENASNYWTVDGSQLGCDIPDAPDSLHSVPSTSAWGHTSDTLRTLPSSNDATSCGLKRESSGASTISVSSGTNSDQPAQGRYVTRVLLRQTLSLNRDSKLRSNWSLTDEEKDDFSLESLVKTEKNETSSTE